MVWRTKKRGVLAQLVERLNGIEEVRGSNPLGSTSLVGGCSKSGTTLSVSRTALEPVLRYTRGLKSKLSLNFVGRLLPSGVIRQAAEGAPIFKRFPSVAYATMFTPRLQLL